ncbi:hypothetical protein V1264_017455 [Littorina saxatilis]|uniref:EGF-like domain-containing protein n=1 Tax=Littorina saxatilis TaxID=31220 RepID=A0AAN9BIM5_9CAEN
MCSKTSHSKPSHSKTNHSKTSHSKTSHSKISHSKTSHSKPSHSKTSNSKTSHNKTSHSKTSHSKTSHSKTSHVQQDKPQQTKPQQNKPQQNKPQQNKPQQNKPQQNKPQQNKPQQNKPQQNKPQQNKPQQTKPQQNKPQQTKPQQNKPQQNKPQQTKPQQNKPHQTKPQQNKPQQNKPQQTKPQQNKPQQTKPNRTNRKQTPKIPKVTHIRRGTQTKTELYNDTLRECIMAQSCVPFLCHPVRECDGGTYFCYAFSSVNASKYDVASVTVSVKDCEHNMYGPECLDTCGRCAGNQTCNSSTGYCLTCLVGWTLPLCKTACEHNTYGPECLDTCGRCGGNQTCNSSTGYCLTCLAGWTPPLCTTAVPEKPLLTPTQQIVVGIFAGAPLSWGFLATLVQVCQILGNAGWMPFLSLGGKEDKKEEEGKGADESSEEEGPPSTCSRFLNFIFCGGAGMCLLSIMFCISCGKLLSNKFSWRKDSIQNDAESKQQQSSLPDNVITDQPVEKNKDSIDVVIYPPDSSADREPISRGVFITTLHETSHDSLDSPDESLDPPEVDTNHAAKKDIAKFTDKYFVVKSWLENPYKDRAQAKKKSHSSRAKKLSGFFSSGFHKKKAKYQTGDQ